MTHSNQQEYRVLFRQKESTCFESDRNAPWGCLPGGDSSGGDPSPWRALPLSVIQVIYLRLQILDKLPITASYDKINTQCHIKSKILD